MSNQKLINFFAFWIANSLVFFAASLIFVGKVVLGNDKVSMPMAAVIAGFVLTVLLTLVAPIVDRTGYKPRNQQALGLVYLVANLVIIWVIKRFALFLGLGVSSIVYVVILGVVLTLVQWGVIMATGKASGKKKGR